MRSSAWNPPCVRVAVRESDLYPKNKTKRPDPFDLADPNIAVPHVETQHRYRAWRPVDFLNLTRYALVLANKPHLSACSAQRCRSGETVAHRSFLGSLDHGGSSNRKASSLGRPMERFFCNRSFALYPPTQYANGSPPGNNDANVASVNSDQLTSRALELQVSSFIETWRDVPAIADVVYGWSCGIPCIMVASRRMPRPSLTIL